MSTLKLVTILIMLNAIVGSEFRENVLRNLINLCPEQYVQAKINSTRTVTKQETSCCLENFNDTIRFHFPSNETTINRPYQRCILPYLRRNSNYLFQESRSYYMVTEAPEGGCVTKNVSVNTEADILNYPTCNDSEINIPLRRFLPVYSRARRLIYKNPHCAHCHGIEDPDNWKVLVNCRHHNDFSTDELSCNLDFLFPRRNEEIQHLECFTERFSQCPQNLSSLVMPYNFDFSIEELRKACLLENLPGYMNYNHYAKNIFCYICHHNLFFANALKTQLCSQETDTILQKTITTKTFSRILDDRAMTSKDQEKTMKSEFDHVCGIDIDKQKCYPVLCPLGQMMIDAGKTRICQMDSSLWIRPQLSLLLLLEFDKEIPVNDSLQETLTKKALSGLKLQYWTTDKIYIPFAKYTNMTRVHESAINFSNGQKINYVKHFFAHMLFNNITIQPEELMTNISETLSAVKWYVISSGRKVDVISKQSRASLWPVDASVPNLQLQMSLYVTSDQLYGYDQPRDQILYKLITLIHKTTSGLVLTKLSFCLQVEIPIHSFDFFKYFDYVVAVYHNYTGRHFLDREFVYRTYWQNIRICVSDFQTGKNSGNRRIHPMLSWYCTVSLITSMFYLLT